MEDYGNAQVARLPRRLRNFVIDQQYNNYTAVDQAVWRYVMRQNYHYLKDIAYYPYIKGLERAGLSIERIPDLQTMNNHLAEIGWGAVTVDGFIPPAAFMEFQSYKVLVIAADIRQLNHIEYTPTPDIIHESAGHAPIIADHQYAEYLRYFGEIGCKALFSKQDFDLYESIRRLSILKEMPGSKDAEIEIMEKEVMTRQQNMGEPSEMALLSRLHWWTVEYGLIGTLENPKIYGAGLLSSIGESVTCMQPTVKKIAYTADAINIPFDITRAQPQLFVTPDFENLMKVLNDFAATMAFQKGGISGLDKGIACKNTCTVTLNSGVQLTGIIDSYKTENKEIVFLEFREICAMAYNNKEIPGMSAHRFPEGICLPLGGIEGFERGLEHCNDNDLYELGLVEGEYGMLEYTSGWIFHGTLKRIRHQDGKPVLLTWLDAELMEPDGKSPVRTWEYFELPLGSSVVSVFNGAADKEAFEGAGHSIDVPAGLKAGNRGVASSTVRSLAGSPASGVDGNISRTTNPPVTGGSATETGAVAAMDGMIAQDDDTNPFISVYALVRKIREEHLDTSGLHPLWKTINHRLDKSWLCALEILELTQEQEGLKDPGAEIRAALLKFSTTDKAYTKLVADGLVLIDQARQTVDAAK